MAFRDYYYKIKDRIREDKAFLGGYPFLSIDTTEMEDEELIRNAVRGFLLETINSIYDKASCEIHGHIPRYWYLPKLLTATNGVDLDTFYTLKRDYIEFPYFLGTRLRLNIDQFSDLILEESSDSWVWPLFMQLICSHVADGALAAMCPLLDDALFGKYAEGGGVVFPALADITTEEIFYNYYRPPYLFSFSDPSSKLDNARNIMYGDILACLKNCEAIVEFLVSKGLTSNDIYVEMNEFKDKLTAALNLAKVANIFQLHAYFCSLFKFLKYKVEEVPYQDPSVYISRMNTLALSEKITFKNSFHGVNSNCMFEITLPTRERGNYKYESVKGRDASNWGSRAWIVDTFPSTDFNRKKFDLTADFPMLKIFTPFPIPTRYELLKNVGAEIPERKGVLREDTDIFALQIIDHITDTSDITKEAQKNFPVALLKIIDIIQYPIRLLSAKMMGILAKKFRMLYILLKINTFFLKSEKVLKLINIVSNLKNMTPMWAALQLILQSEKITHPFFRTGRLMRCDDLPMSVSLFLPLLELIFSEVLDEIDLNTLWISIDPDEARLIKKYLSCKILRDIL